MNEEGDAVLKFSSGGYDDNHNEKEWLDAAVAQLEYEGSK